MEYKSPKIIALEIEEFGEEGGVDAIALVEQPAIQEDFYYFSEQSFESYTDYPEAATENAKIALRWADENGWGSCGTPVGKARANQLANREAISEDTIARMAAFERHRQNSTKELGDGCGRLMWLAWGGDEGIAWAQRKLKQIRTESASQELNEELEIDVFGYTTQFFYMCPGAIATFLDYKEQSPDEETKGMIRSAAQIADNVFRIEQEVINKGDAELEELGEAQTLVDDYYDLIREIDDILGTTTDVSYMEGHLEVIRKYIDELVLEYLIQEELGQTQKTEFAVESKEKQLIAGPLMIPRKLIYRYDAFKDEDYYVYFTEETIEKLAYKYLMNKYQDNTNLEHSEDIKLKDVVLVESWIIEEPEKDKAFFLTNKKYPKGTWFGIMKVLNQTVWKEWIKTGRVKGFSVEGYFSDRIINASKHKFYYRTTEGGTEIVIDHETLVVFILEDGERKAIMPDGTYELKNGQTLKVIDSKAVKGSF